MPKVSVILPVYNNDIYLSQAIESVLHQTCKDFELIIVDDGSIDKTGEIAKKYADANPGVVLYIYQENKGPGAARNTALKEAKGKYIAFIDGDDKWLESKLEKQVEVLDNNPDVGLVYSDFYYFSERKTKTVLRTKKEFELPRGDTTIHFFFKYFMFTSTVMVRKVFTDKVGFFREDIFVGEDFDFFLRLSTLCKVERLRGKLLAKRSRPDSLSSVDWVLNAKNDFLVLNDFISKNPKYYRQHRKEIAEIISLRSFDLGYGFLKKGKKLFSLPFFFNALRYRVSLKTIKCLLLLPFPIRFIDTAKKLIQGPDATFQELE